MLGIDKLDESFFNRDKNIVNLANSLLSHFGVKPFHPTLEAADKALKGHKKVAVFLFDGMGEIVLRDFGKPGASLLRHKIETIYSTNPATTAASTNAFLSARYPIETGWLGWSQYYEELGRSINVFPGVDSYTGLDINAKGLHSKVCGYENIASLMRKQGVNAECMYEYPLNNEQGPKTLAEMMDRAASFFSKGGEFLYSYWTKPDSFMHDHGEHSKFVRSYIGRINKAVRNFAKENPDILVFVIADHGQINVHYEDIAEKPGLRDLVEYPISIEHRTPTFVVRKGKEKEFEEEFEKEYGSRAVLFTKKEALEKGYFGEGVPHYRSEGFIADYVAVMLDDTCIWDTRGRDNPHAHKGHHAGGTDKERLIALLAYNI